MRIGAHGLPPASPFSGSTGMRQMTGSFIDTNVLIYLFSSDATKADLVDELSAAVERSAFRC